MGHADNDNWFEFGSGQEWLNVIVIILSLGSTDVQGKASTQGVVWALTFGWLWVMHTHQNVPSRGHPGGPGTAVWPLMDTVERGPAQIQ